MVSTETQIARPKGWNDAAFEQLQQLIKLARGIEELGGSEGILALMQAEPAQAPTTGSAQNWANSEPIKLTISAKSWTTIHIVLTTQDGHSAQCDFSSVIASLIWTSLTVAGTLYYNGWPALMAGPNDVTINTNSGLAPLVVNGTTVGEIRVPVTLGVPPLAVSGSFTWTA